MNELSNNFFEDFVDNDYESWKVAAEKALKGVNFDKAMFTNTYEGITLKPIYNQEDYKQIEAIRNTFPGLNPFIRSSKIDGYLNKTWEIAQNIPYPLPYYYNQALQKDLNNGQDAINLYFDRASSLYEDYTFDDISGVELIINNIDDIGKTLKNIDLNKYSLNIFAGISSFSVFVAIITYLKNNKYDLNSLKINFNFDIFSDLMIEGQLEIKLESLLDQLALATKWTLAHSTKMRTILIDSSILHNSGAHSIQELAMSMSMANYIIKGLLERDIKIEDIAKNFIFNFSVGTNFFMEIAKLRAARIVWFKLLSEYGLKPDQTSMFISTETSYRDSTYFDPNVNMLRATSETFSAIMGGTNSHTVHNYDEIHSLPNDFSRRVARNIQNVLKYESHLTDTIDPAGGSWYIEVLTYELAKNSWEKFSTIESNKGILELLYKGNVQDCLSKITQDRIQNAALRRETILGTNKYPNLKDTQIINELPFTMEDIEKHIDDFDNSLEKRNLEKIDEILNNFESNCDFRNIDVIELLIQAYNEGATIAEVSNSIPLELEQTIIKPLITSRTSEPFEELRYYAEIYKEENDFYPQLKFVCFGKLKEYKARVDFSSDFFLVGGFENKIIDNNITAENAINKIDKNNKDIYVICSTDDIYSEVVPEFARKMKEINKENYLILAGYPKDKVDEYKENGIDMFIHIKSNILETLTELQKIAGISDNSNEETI